MAKIQLITFFILFVTIFLSIFVPSQSASIIKKRAIDEDDKKPAPECQNNTPCGWAIYTPFTRNIEYFMKNSCECSESKQCIRTDDDISVSAYVYRCREPKRSSNTSTSTNPPSINNS